MSKKNPLWQKCNSMLNCDSSLLYLLPLPSWMHITQLLLQEDRIFGPYWQVPLAHIWLWHTTLIQAEHCNQNPTTYPLDMEQFVVFSLPLGHAWPAQHLSYPISKIAVGIWGHLWLTNTWQKAMFGQLWDISGSRRTCQCCTWAIGTKSSRHN